MVGDAAGQKRMVHAEQSRIDQWAAPGTAGIILYFPVHLRTAHFCAAPPPAAWRNRLLAAGYLLLSFFGVGIAADSLSRTHRLAGTPGWPGAMVAGNSGCQPGRAGPAAPSRGFQETQFISPGKQSERSSFLLLVICHHPGFYQADRLLSGNLHEHGDFFKAGRFPDPSHTRRVGSHYHPQPAASRTNCR